MLSLVLDRNLRKTCVSVFSEPHRLKEVIFSSNFPFYHFFRAPRCLCSTLPLELELAAPYIILFWHAVSSLAAQTILVWQKTFLDWNSFITALSRWESCFLFLAYSTLYIAAWAEQRQILIGGEVGGGDVQHILWLMVSRKQRQHDKEKEVEKEEEEGPSRLLPTIPQENWGQLPVCIAAALVGNRGICPETAFAVTEKAVLCISFALLCSLCPHRLYILYIFLSVLNSSSYFDLSTLLGRLP